jgi:CRP-like cAMP-binding protein
MIPLEELKEIELLRNLDEPHLQEIAKIARPKECGQGTIVFRQGEDSPHIYFVLGGDVALQVEEFAGNPVVVSTIGRGGLLGWSPVLGRQAMTATARAVSDCRLAVLDVAQVLALCEQDPRFGMAFLRQIALVVSERLWGTRRNLARALSHRPLLGATPQGSD